MNALPAKEQIAMASTYEDLGVPAPFQEWAARLVDAVCIQPGHRALDIACGTGVLAREAAACIGVDFRSLIPCSSNLTEDKS
jgi:2-polyprenyl-3-methyl-5-hydroxy-6-metoxy-1,4-benzoquinol methylase